jgi:hypothetical protein
MTFPVATITHHPSMPRRPRREVGARAETTPFGRLVFLKKPITDSLTLEISITPCSRVLRLAKLRSGRQSPSGPWVRIHIRHADIAVIERGIEIAKSPGAGALKHVGTIPLGRDECQLRVAACEGTLTVAFQRLPDPVLNRDLFVLRDESLVAFVLAVSELKHPTAASAAQR